MSFRGEFHHSIDDKGRISIPAKLRDVILSVYGGRLVITRTPYCLEAYSPEEWSEVESWIGQLSRVNTEAQRYKRFFYSAATEVEMDKQGRILVPPHLRSSADLSSEIVLVGMQNKLEIWSRERWEKDQKDLLGDWDSITDSLSDKGL
jgi:MraZ protein